MIRKITEADRECVIELMEEFYHSPAVLHPVPKHFFSLSVDEVLSGSPYAELYLLYSGQNEDRPAGYAMTAKTFSNEAGGLVVWLEELYLRPDFRGHGLGSEFFAFIEDTYRGKAARLRLEVEEDNVAARCLYERLGYRPLPYLQMIKE